MRFPLINRKLGLIQTHEVKLHFGSSSNRSPSPGPSAEGPPSPQGRGTGGEGEIVTKLTAVVLVLIFTLSILLGGCSWFRIKKIRRIPASEQALPAKTASLTELVTQINSFAENIKSLRLNVLYQLSGASISTGEISEYRETEGFILLKKPGFVRLIGLAFKVKVFDMVSDGKDFHIYIPPKNKYIYGFNDQEITPRKDIPVTLRPQHVFSALMIDPLQPNPEQERLSIEEGEEGKKKFYVVTLLKEMGNGLVVLERKIWVDRFDLRLVRQKHYDKEGKVRTDVIFNNFQNYQGKDYPSVIDFRRPQDQYSLRIRVKQAFINSDLRDDQFTLQQPEGSELVDLTKESTAKQ